MSKSLLARYYQENKKNTNKKFVKGIKTLLNKKKKKGNNVVMNDTEIFQKMKNKTLMGIGKKHYRKRKMLDYNYKRLLF